ncbi:MAG: RHS repeat-associated core domain-containing protein, partial [bacterium]|nr:RHS repeat-associated core domain-containing protein [bacterium]
RTDAAGTTKFEYGPDRLLSVDHPTDGRAYYLFDALGSVVDLTTPAGALLAQYQWDAWGNLRASTETVANPFGFTGHEMDGESGLIYAKARFYDPTIALWLSQDPAGADLENPPSLHKYLYVWNNPVFFVDPDGRNPRMERDMHVAAQLQRESRETAITAIENLPVLGTGIEVANLALDRDILRNEELGATEKVLSVAAFVPIPKVVKRGAGRLLEEAVERIADTSLGQRAFDFVSSFGGRSKKSPEVAILVEDKEVPGVRQSLIGDKSGTFRDTLGRPRDAATGNQIAESNPLVKAQDKQKGERPLGSSGLPVDEQGRVGEGVALDRLAALERKGKIRIEGDQVMVSFPDGKPGILDILIERVRDKKRFNIEVKSGKGSRGKAQVLRDERLARGEGVFYGRRARQAGIDGPAGEVSTAQFPISTEEILEAVRETEGE